MDYDVVVFVIAKIAFFMMLWLGWSLLKWSIRALKQKITNRKVTKISAAAGPKMDAGLSVNKCDNWSLLKQSNPFK